MHAYARAYREHPELSEAVVEEMMTRQVECCDPTTQQPTLACLVPWVDNLSMAREWQVRGLMVKGAA